MTMCEFCEITMEIKRDLLELDKSNPFYCAEAKQLKQSIDDRLDKIIKLGTNLFEEEC